ncbi:MAG: hypothetical protein HeimC3_09490 [Candidatus Heimdallarchaeota archaeon LC_3]|nr:MAG: hypothetical protein HeimC3_09490 [Candidatus Heimdallarchaeota archaeon LC_3]
MFNLSKISFTKFDPTSLSQDSLNSLVKLYSEYIDFRDTPLPKFSKKYYEKWIINPKYGDIEHIYYIAENINTQTVVGMSVLRLNIGKDNLNLAFTYFFVKKQYRRKGIAKNLLKIVYKDIPEIVNKIIIYYRPEILDENRKMIENNRKLLIFLKKNHGIKVFTERRSISDIKSFDIKETIKKAHDLKEKAYNLGYDLFFIQGGVRNHPKINFSAYVSMIEKITNDMPKEDGSWSDVNFSPEFYENFQKHFISLGHYFWTFVLVHRKSSLPIGMTETWFHSDNPTLAQQADTGILHDHRGKGFGLTLKYQMLAKILTDKSTQEIKHWQTSNANSNTHMIKINNELRHKEKVLFNEFEFKKEDVKNYLWK